MLIGGISGLSAIFAVVLWGTNGGFEELARLWVLPVAFLGTFLVLGTLAFLFLWIMCILVDQNVPQEKDSPFYRRMLYPYAQAIMTIVQVRLHKKGFEQKMPEGRFLLVCNHLSDMDPVVLHWCFRKYQLAFISKRENSSMFIVGKMMHKTMCQMINRENDREALRTILKCVQLLNDDEVSVAVFPEGYTSLDGRLQRFRGGVFKIAQKAHVPIVVCTLQGTEKVFHNAKRLKKTDVQLHILGVIPPEELKGVTALGISERVYNMMLADLGEDYRPAEQNA